MFSHLLSIEVLGPGLLAIFFAGILAILSENIKK